VIVDGYAHCGVSKYQPVEVVLDVMNKTGVDRALLCQHLGEYDNNYLAEVVRRYSERFAAVCLVDPAEADSLERLKYWHKTGQFKGVRLLAEWMEPYFPLWGEAAQLGLNLLVYAPNGIAEAVPTVRRLLMEYPNGRIVISHLGNPKLVGGDRVEGSEIFQLDQLDGVFVLISGLSMFCPYPYLVLRPFISEVVDRFASERLLWGSNFPVCGDKDAYLRDLTQLLEGDWGLGADEIQDLSGGTANRLWFGEDVRLR
jgi:predicted TIM-barrel fold metal-dependent hydrolase